MDPIILTDALIEISKSCGYYVVYNTGERFVVRHIDMAIDFYIGSGNVIIEKLHVVSRVFNSQVCKLYSQVDVFHFEVESGSFISKYEELLEECKR